MDPELKALIEAAKAKGASVEELRLIVMEYHDLKKKDSTSDSDSATAPSSLASPSTSGTGTQGASGGSVTPAVAPESTYTFEGETISSEDATLIGQYSDEYENSYRKHLDDNFSLEQYLASKPQLSKSMEGLTPEEQEEKRKNIISGIVDSKGLHSEESRRELLLGMDEEYAEELRAINSRREFETNLPKEALDSPWYYFQGQNAKVDPEQQARQTSSANSKAKTESDLAFEKANHKFSNVVTAETSEKVRSLLPEEMQSNPEKQGELERYMLKVPSSIGP